MMGADLQLREHLEQSLEALGYREQRPDQETVNDEENPGKRKRRSRKKTK